MEKRLSKISESEDSESLEIEVNSLGPSEAETGTAKVVKIREVDAMHQTGPINPGKNDLDVIENQQQRSPSKNKTRAKKKA